MGNLIQLCSYILCECCLSHTHMSSNYRDGASTQQVWDLEFDGVFEDSVTMTFAYDDSILSEYYQANEGRLGINHYGKYGVGGAREWRFLRDSVDTVNNTITITVDNFSPFVLGALPSVPEPSAFILATLSLLSLAMTRRRRRR
jgi:hypothetical protein